MSGYEYTITNTIIDGINSSRIVVTNESEMEIYNQTFIHSQNAEDDRLYVRNELIDHGESIKDTLDISISELGTLIENLETIVMDLDNILGETYSKTDIAHSTYYSISLLKIIKRAIESSESCECHTNTTFLVNSKYFACTEDIILHASTVSSFLDTIYANYSYSEIDSVGYDSVKTFVDNNPSSSFSMLDMHKMMEGGSGGGIFPTEPTSGAGLFCPDGHQGSDLGCCGNYSGDCYFCSMGCLKHDIACFCCDKWHCGWACSSDC